MSSWRNQLISQRVNSRSHYLHLCFGADILLQQLQIFRFRRVGQQHQLSSKWSIYNSWLVSSPPWLCNFITFDWYHYLHYHQYFYHLCWAILSLYWSSCLYANCVSYHQWTMVTMIEGQAICSGAHQLKREDYISNLDLFRIHSTWIHDHESIFYA